MAWYRNVNYNIDPRVYDPSDDSFMLIDCLDVCRGDRVLEVGCGCGLVSIHCAREGGHVTCSDINRHALKLAKSNARMNNMELRAIRADIFRGNRSRFDIVIFNPPYLPVGPEERVAGEWIEMAVSGGSDGADLIRRFIPQLKDHLTKKGRGYMIVSSSNPVDELMELASNSGLKVEVAGKLGLFMEVVYCWRLTCTR